MELCPVDGTNIGTSCMGFQMRCDNKEENMTNVNKDK